MRMGKSQGQALQALKSQRFYSSTKKSSVRMGQEVVERGELLNNMFSDENNLPIEQFLKLQNDRVYLTERSY